jgi:hypothetical protein
MQELDINYLQAPISSCLSSPRFISKVPSNLQITRETNDVAPRGYRA